MAQQKDYKFTLSAGAEQRHKVVGTFYRVVYTSTTNDIEISFDNGAWITRSEGMGGGGVFKEFAIRSAVGQSVTIAIATEPGATIEDSRATVNASVNTTVAPADTLTSNPDVNVLALSTAVLAPVNANRKEILIHNHVTNLATHRIGGPTVGAANGTPLPPGASIVLAVKSAVSAYNPSGTAETLAVSEMTTP